MDLGAFGEWWNSNIGIWWNTVDWGNVPAWVGSILTSVSVFLAVNILRADRKRLRHAPADALATWHTTSIHVHPNKKDVHKVKVHAYNTGDAPVPFALLEAPMNTPEYELKLFKDSGGGLETVEPKEHLLIQLSYDFEPNMELFYVRFTDSTGKHWIRMLKSGKYISVRKFKRFSKGPRKSRLAKQKADLKAAREHNSKK
jgi:hypothetical protein